MSALRSPLWRSPLLHFVLIGAVLYVGQRHLSMVWIGSLPTVEVRTADIDRLRRQWIQDTRQAPDAAQLTASVQRFVDQQVLLEEALRLGLDRQDPIARQRLVMNMRLVADATQPADDAALLAQAGMLGMARRDPVVVRRLVQAMEQRLQSGLQLSAAEVDVAVSDYLAVHAERYQRAARIDFSQVFVHDDERRARRLLVQLQRGTLEVDAAGDAFALGRHFSARRAADVRRQWGAALSDALFAAPEGTWIGPLRSHYGWHLLRVERRRAAMDADATAVARARYAWLQQHEQQVLREAIRALRRRYEIRMPDGWDALT